MSQAIPLGETDDVQFNGQAVDYLYLNTGLIWSRNAILAEDGQWLLSEAGDILETE